MFMKNSLLGKIYFYLKYIKIRGFYYSNKTKSQETFEQMAQNCYNNYRF